MDATSLFIIFIATALAIVFKYVLYKKIQRWIDQDLIKGLANGNSDKHAFLTQKHQEFIANKVKRKEYHQLLTELAEEFEQTK
ncbi:MAG: hypothetical protein ACPF9K_09190 [Neptuniibacter sp.]